MLHCFAGCEEEAVLAALGITSQDLFYEHFRPEDRPTPAKVRAHVKPVAAARAESEKPARSYRTLTFPGLGNPAKTYEYRSASGELLYVVCRYVTDEGRGKEFRRFTPAGEGRWFRKGPEAPERVLYGLPEVRRGIEAGATVVLVEGEKDADTGNALGAEGMVFTSADGGANAHWQPQYTAELAGAELVRIVADADEPGRKHAAEVAAELEAAGLTVVVEESDRGKDLTDHLEAGGTLADLVPADLPPVPPKPPAPPGGADGGDGDGGDEDGLPVKRLTGPKFVVDRGKLWRETLRKDEQGRWRRELVLVLGCQARITKTIRRLALDPDVDAQAGGLVSDFELEATHPETGEVREFRVPVKDWRDASWLDSLWPDVTFRKDRSGRSEVLSAVAAQSAQASEEFLLTATGWTEVAGQRAYVHAGGAITADGVVEVATDLPGALGALCLEPPSRDGDELRDDMAESVGWLFEDWLPRRVSVVLNGTVYRSILPCGTGLSAMLVGPPGGMKTAVSLIAAEHFAPSVNHTNRRYLSMSDSGATLRASQTVMHRAKDVALVVDDFPPRASNTDSRSGRDQSSICRAVYGRDTRERLDQDGSLKRGAPLPRCEMLTSAEYAPQDQGARERVLVVPFMGVDPPLEKIIAAQGEERAKSRSRFMAWLIRETAKVTEAEVARWANERDGYWAKALRDAGYSPRTAEHVGKVLTGWAWVFDRLTAAGLMDADGAAALWQATVWPAAVEAAQANADPDADTTITGQLVRLIGGVLGRGYVADAQSPDQPPSALDAADCGWTTVMVGQHVEYRPRAGAGLMGWVKGDRLWLDPATVLSAVHKLAQEEGGYLAASSVNAASAILVAARVGMMTDQGKHLHRVRVGKLRHYVWDLPVDLFWSDDDGPADEAQPGPDGPPPAPPVPPTPPAPPAPDLPPSQPVTPERPLCQVCGEPMIPIDGSTAHPGCPTPDEQASKQAKPAETPGRVSPSGSRWRAAEVMVTAGGAVLPDGTRLALPEVLRHVGDLAAWAQDQRIGSGGGKDRPEPGRVWLARDFLEARGLPVRDLGAEAEGRSLDAADALAQAITEAWQGNPFLASASSDGFSTGQRAGSWTKVWRSARDGGQASVIVTSPEWVSTTALTVGDTNPEHLIRRLGLWTWATGQPLVINEGVSFRSMCQLDAARLPDLPWARMSADFMWQRTPTEAELGRAFVHAYDRRKSYLAASSSVVASNRLVEVETPAIDVRTPGFWHVARCDWAELGYQVADPRVDYEGLLCEWVATPTLALLAEHCRVLEVDRAWLYEGRTSRVCERAYDTTRLALEKAERWDQADPDVAAVVAGLKASYRTGIGMMNMTRDEGTQKRGHRPDVRATIIATHRANSIRAMLSAGLKGSWPLAMARADTVLFASDNGDAAEAWPGKPDGMTSLLGKYKAAGTATMGDWRRLTGDGSASPSVCVWAVTDPAKAVQERPLPDGPDGAGSGPGPVGGLVYVDDEGVTWHEEPDGVVWFEDADGNRREVTDASA
jgi:hypothetical protein